MVNLAGGPGAFSFHFGPPAPRIGADSPSVELEFSASSWIALLFEGQQPGALSRWLERHPGQPFQEAWNRGLTSGERQNFEQIFGHETTASLLALSQESDPALFGEGLLRLAGRLESSEHLEAAGLAYQVLQAANISPSVNDRAQHRLNAIRGQGDSWARAGFLGQRLLAQASEPAALVGMGVAGMVGRSVRLAMLSRLAVSPAGTLTRGLGARTLASSAALALEAPAFTASTRGVNVMLGRPQDWSGRAVWREFASGATTLVGLKVSGAFGGALVRRYAQGESLLARSGQLAISQTSMLGGIYLSHRAEQTLGFRDHVDGETAAVDTLSTWIQFNLAGALSRRIMGEGFRQAELSMERRTELLARQNAASRPTLPDFSALRAVLARSAPLAAVGMATCLAGCSVAGEHPANTPALLAILGIMATARLRGRNSSSSGPTAAGEPVPTEAVPVAAPQPGPISQSRRVQVRIGSGSLEMEARSGQAIHDRLLESYEIALRDLLEGTETGFAMLQGEVADQLRSDHGLRQRILDASAPSLSQRRVRAVVGPAGRLLGFEFIEALGLLDSPIPAPEAAPPAATPDRPAEASEPPALAPTERIDLSDSAPRIEALRTLELDDRVLALLALHQEVAPNRSFRSFVHAINTQFGRGENFLSLKGAGNIDLIFRRWEEWEPHFAFLAHQSTSPQQRRSASAARLLQPDGTPYPAETLAGLTRWGIFLLSRRYFGGPAATNENPVPALSETVQPEIPVQVETAPARSTETQSRTSDPLPATPEAAEPVARPNPVSEPAAERLSWRSVRARINDFRDTNFTDWNPLEVVAAQRALDTLERLETVSGFSSHDAELLLDRFEEILTSGSRNFDSIHQQRRAMSQQSAALIQLRSWGQDAPEEAVVEAHRTFHRFFHPRPLVEARLAEAIGTLLSILRAELPLERRLAAFRELQAAVTENRSWTIDLEPAATEPPAPPIEALPPAIDAAPATIEPVRILSIDGLEAELTGLGRNAAATGDTVREAKPLPSESEAPSSRELLLPPPPSAPETVLDPEAIEAPARPATLEVPLPEPASEPRLGNLLGRAGDPEMIRIERFIQGDNSHQRDALPPRLQRLREIRRDLRRLSNLDPLAQEARDSLLSGIEELIQGPSSESLVEFTQRVLPLSPTSAEMYETLSPLAREGFYLLVVALRGQNRSQLDQFLGRCTSTEETNQILETVALLHDRGVRGYENAFVPTGRDEKFLSSDPSRIHSLQAENSQALRLAGQAHVRRLWLAQRMRIDWSRLTASERQMIDEQVIPALGRNYRYDEQRSVEVDAGYQTITGGNRIVEVKTSRGGTLNPQGEQAASIVLQAFRHALLVRQHNLEGVEYILEAATVSTSFVSSLENVLTRLRVPFIIRVHETQSGARRTLRSNMEAAEGESRASQERLRPLPLPNRQHISTPPVESVGNEASRPWTPDMIDFMNRALPSAERFSRRSTRQEVLFGLTYLSSSHFFPIRDYILAFAEQTRRTNPALADRIVEMTSRAQPRSFSTRLAGPRASMLLDIAAIATGAEIAPDLPASRPSQDQSLSSFLQYSAAAFEAYLVDYEKSLQGLQDLSRDNEPEELREYLEEYSPDAPLATTQSIDGEGGWTLRSLFNRLQSPDMEAFRDTYGQRLEKIIEDWETLHSMLVLGERTSLNP